MDQISHEVRFANWKAIVKECQSRPEGQSQKQWLRDHDIPEKQYYYWLRKIRKQTFEETALTMPVKENRPAISPALVEIPAKEIFQDTAPAIRIRTKRSTIEISAAVPETMMIQVLKAVSHAL